MFKHLAAAVEDYNNSNLGKAILQEYNAHFRKAFIFCIVTNLMFRMHEKIPQSGELCYMDMSASFDPLNTSVILLYTSCSIGALPLRMLITSDKLKITLEKAVII